jgi:hypothetical protein
MRYARRTGEDGLAYGKRVRSIWENANAILSANRYALEGVQHYATTEAKSLADVVAYLSHYHALAAALRDHGVPEVARAAETYVTAWDALLKLARNELSPGDAKLAVDGLQNQALHYAAAAWEKLGAICGEWGLRFLDLSIPLHVQPTAPYQFVGRASVEGENHA